MSEGFEPAEGRAWPRADQDATRPTTRTPRRAISATGRLAGAGHRRGAPSGAAAARSSRAACHPHVGKGVAGGGTTPVPRHDDEMARNGAPTTLAPAPARGSSGSMSTGDAPGVARGTGRRPQTGATRQSERAAPGTENGKQEATEHRCRAYTGTIRAHHRTDHEPPRQHTGATIRAAAATTRRRDARRQQAHRRRRIEGRDDQRPPGAGAHRWLTVAQDRRAAHRRVLDS